MCSTYMGPATDRLGLLTFQTKTLACSLFDTHPSIGEEGVALFNQDSFDDGKIQNGHQGLPPFEKPTRDKKDIPVLAWNAYLGL